MAKKQEINRDTVTQDVIELLSTEVAKAKVLASGNVPKVPMLDQKFLRNLTDILRALDLGNKDAAARNAFDRIRVATGVSEPVSLEDLGEDEEQVRTMSKQVKKMTEGNE